MALLIGLFSDAMGSGKSTVAQHLARKHGFEVVPFAMPLKRMTRSLLELVNDDPQWLVACLTDSAVKEQPIEALGGVTLRQLWQTLGTEWGRQMIDPDFWVRIWRARVERLLDQGVPVVADDVRFPNEARAVEDLMGFTVKVIRPGAEVTRAHVSEGGLRDRVMTWQLMNNGLIADLEQKADQMVDVLGVGA